MKLTEKMKITGVAAATALSIAPASAEIELNPNISVSGFVDMSAYILSSDPGETENDANLDQVEIDFILKYDPVSANIDLEYRTDGDVTVEQAYLTYKFDEASSFTAGRFLSYMGYEGDEPYKLFQYSYAYDFGLPYAGYNDGVKYDYSSDSMSFGAALVSSNYNRTSRVSDEFGIELKATFTPVEGLTIFTGYSFDSKETSDDVSYYNLWAQYQTGALTFAGELGYMEDEDFAVMGSHTFWLALVNYAASDKVGLTGRVSGQVYDDDGPSNTKLTFSPSYKIADNLLLVSEISYTSYSDLFLDDESGDEYESDTFFAVELLFTF